MMTTKYKVSFHVKSGEKSNQITLDHMPIPAELKNHKYRTSDCFLAIVDYVINTGDAQFDEDTSGDDYKTKQKFYFKKGTINNGKIKIEGHGEFEFDPKKDKIIA